jgi:hypothetical protein
VYIERVWRSYSKRSLWVSEWVSEFIIYLFVCLFYWMNILAVILIGGGPVGSVGSINLWGNQPLYNRVPFFS